MHILFYIQKQDMSQQSNWKGIVTRSSQIKIRQGKSRSKYTPKRQHDQQSQQGFIKFRDQKSISHNRSLLELHNPSTSRSQVTLRQKNLQTDSASGSPHKLTSIIDAGRSPLKREESIDESLVKGISGPPTDRQFKFSLLTKKNEGEIIKLKRQFLDFQRNVMNQLKRQQTFINQMCDNILQKMHKMVQQTMLKIQDQQIELNSHGIITFKDINQLKSDIKLQQRQKICKSSQPNKQQGDISIHNSDPKITDQNSYKHQPNMNKNSGKNSNKNSNNTKQTTKIVTNLNTAADSIKNDTNLGRYRQAIQSMKDRMKEISQLCDIGQSQINLNSKQYELSINK